MFFNKKLTARRARWAALCLPIVLGLVWAWYEDLAIVHNVAIQKMDWNNDGEVSRTEFLQAFYAVQVRDTIEGRRQCRAFIWRVSGEIFRHDCITVFKADNAGR